MERKRNKTIKATEMCAAFAQRADAEWEAACEAEGLRPLNLFLCSTYSGDMAKNTITGQGLCVVVSNSKAGSLLLPVLVAAMKSNDEFRRLLEDAVVMANS